MTSDEPTAPVEHPQYQAVPPGEGGRWPTFEPPKTAPPAKPRRWLVIAVAAWCAILAAGATWAAFSGEATAREQTTAADALPVLDRAAADLVTAAISDGQAVAALSALSQTDCSVTAARSGLRYQRAVTAFVTPGTEGALLGRVAARLPASYHAVASTEPVPRLAADAGLYVAVSATVPNPGQVRLLIDSGDCRAAGDGGPAAAAQPSAAQRAPIEAALRRLGVTASNWRLYQAACPAGGTLSTVEATAAGGTAIDRLVAAFAAGSDALAVRAPDLVAYRAEGVGVVVRAGDKSLVVSATSPCPGQ